MTGRRQPRVQRAAAQAGSRAITRDPFANMRAMAVGTERIPAADMNVVACSIGFDTTALKISDPVPLVLPGGGQLSQVYSNGVLQERLTLANGSRIELSAVVQGAGLEVRTLDLTSVAFGVNGTALTDTNEIVIDDGPTEYKLRCSGASFPSQGALREKLDWGLRTPYGADGKPLGLVSNWIGLGRDLYGTAASEPSWAGKAVADYDIVVAKNFGAGPVAATTSGFVLGFAAPAARLAYVEANAVTELAKLKPIIILKVVAPDGTTLSPILAGSIGVVAASAIQAGGATNVPALSMVAPLDQNVIGDLAAATAYAYYVFRNVDGNLYPMEVVDNKLIRAIPAVTPTNDPVFSVEAADMVLGPYGIPDKTPVVYGDTVAGVVTKVGFAVGSAFTALAFPDTAGYGAPKFDMTKFLGYAADLAANTNSRRAYEVALAHKAAGVAKVYCCVPALPAPADDPAYAAAHTAEQGIIFVLPTSYNVSEVLLKMKDLNKRNLIYIAGREEKGSDTYDYFVQTMPLFELRSDAINGCIRQFSLWAAGANGYSPDLVSSDLANNSIASSCVLNAGFGQLTAGSGLTSVVSNDKRAPIGDATTAPIHVTLSLTTPTTLFLGKQTATAGIVEGSGIMNVAADDQRLSTTGAGTNQISVEVAAAAADINFGKTDRGSKNDGFVMLFGDAATRVKTSKSAIPAVAVGNAKALENVSIACDLTRSDGDADFYSTFLPYPQRITAAKNAAGKLITCAEQRYPPAALPAACENIAAIFSRHGGNATAILNLLAAPGPEGHISGLSGVPLYVYASEVAKAGRVEVFASDQITLRTSSVDGNVIKMQVLASFEQFPKTTAELLTSLADDRSAAADSWTGTAITA